MGNKSEEEAQSEAAKAMTKKEDQGLPEDYLGRTDYYLNLSYSVGGINPMWTGQRKPSCKSIDSSFSAPQPSG